MKRTIGAASIALAVLGTGAARASVDRKISEEEQRRLDHQKAMSEAERLAELRAGADVLERIFEHPKADPADDPEAPLPDRLCVDENSPYFNGPLLAKIGVRFDGRDRPGDVHEYCVSEGWVRLRVRQTNGKFRMERGKFVTLKQHGKVEPYRK